MLTACGGSDDPTLTRILPTATLDPVDDPSEREPTISTDATSTRPPSATSVATATSGPTTTPTPHPTNTPHPEPTPTSNTSPTGETNEGSGDDASPGVQDGLIAMLLSEDDLPEGWEFYTAGPAGEAAGGITFCDVPPFDNQGNRLGAVEAEFDQHPQEGPFLLQHIAAYPEEVAQEAFNYLRETMNGCSTWTDDDGTGVSQQIVDVPALGDESLGIHMTLQTPAGEAAMAEFTFVRLEGLLLTLVWLTLDEVDTVQFNEILETAISRMEASDFHP